MNIIIVIYLNKLNLQIYPMEQPNFAEFDRLQERNKNNSRMGKVKKTTLYVNISDFGSIAQVNPYEPVENKRLKYWIRNYYFEAWNYLKRGGFIIYDNAQVDKDFEEFEIQKDLILKQVTQQNVDDKQKEIEKALDVYQQKRPVSQETLTNMKKIIQSDVNKSMGSNEEANILNQVEKLDNVKIGERNDKIYYKIIYEDDTYIYKIGGKVDGIVEGSDLVTEAKGRTTLKNVRKNKYDLYQLMGYIFVTDRKRGKISQKFDGKVYTSDVETNNEWGIIELDERWTQFMENHLMNFFESLKDVNNIDPGRTAGRRHLQSNPVRQPVRSQGWRGRRQQGRECRAGCGGHRRELLRRHQRHGAVRDHPGRRRGAFG
jgi:hypothetical protein